MDKTSEQFIVDTLHERFELANAAMRQESSEYSDMTQRLLELSDEINQSPEISTEMKCKIENYLSHVAEMDEAFRRYLYRQGAKDCVAMLRELDLIK